MYFYILGDFTSFINWTYELFYIFLALLDRLVDQDLGIFFSTWRFSSPGKSSNSP